ncbi:hypothetical protein G6F43_000980 [Rhizopus delemar]|nr:hypothetical protein G6F43_000980 [Rhizopus delemar]
MAEIVEHVYKALQNSPPVMDDMEFLGESSVTPTTTLMFLLPPPKYLLIKRVLIASTKLYSPCNHKVKSVVPRGKRMERVLTYICPPVKYAVVRYLYEQGWIGKSLLNEIVASRRSQFTESLYIEYDDEMTTVNLSEV